MLVPRTNTNFALAYVAGKIFCFGAKNIDSHLDLTFTVFVECCDIAADQWIHVPPMPTTAVYLNAVVHDQFVYVLGGRTDLTTRDSLLRFDHRCPDWTTLSAMPTQLWCVCRVR